MAEEITWHITDIGVQADTFGTEEDGRQLFIKKICSKCVYLTKCASEDFAELESAAVALNLVHQLPRYAHRCLSFKDS